MHHGSPRTRASPYYYFRVPVFRALWIAISLAGLWLMLELRGNRVLSNLAMEILTQLVMTVGILAALLLGSNRFDTKEYAGFTLWFWVLLGILALPLGVCLWVWLD